MPLPELSQRFLTYDYAETKDLCKQFLTLVSGILVFYFWIVLAAIAFLALSCLIIAGAASLFDKQKA